tara:strand:+ start:2013 stop:2537 length:525 start_codon:yes stop_codon:yes gene_type:complete
MIKNIKLFFFLSLALVIFFVMLKGLNNLNKYSKEIITTEIDPDILFKTLYLEKEVNLNQLTDKNEIYLINIWASWCLPCKDEHSLLMRLNKDKINIIGLNYKDTKSNAKKFIKNLGNPYSEILIDSNGTKSIELGAIGVPETYLINANSNKVIKKFVGPLIKENYQEIIKLTKK